MISKFFRRRSNKSNSASRNKPRATRRHIERLESRRLLSVSGDFNGDGFDDLAVASPFEQVGEVSNAGAVSIIYGTRNALNAKGNQHWTLDSRGVNGVPSANGQFGHAMAAGDFNGDGFDDLAISAVFATVSGKSQAGSVHILYGSKKGLTAKNDQRWTQDSPGINEKVEAVDQFGYALAAGDFNGDGRDDLAIGVNGEDVGNVQIAGSVSVIYGSRNGLTGSNDQLWHQDSPGINETAEANDQFGFSLAVGDFNGDGRDDLAIGVFGESVSGKVGAGAVAVIYGSAKGLTKSGDQLWTQDSAGVLDAAEIDDHFGESIAAGDFNGDGRDDLAIGTPRESTEASNASGNGAVTILPGSANKLTSAGGLHLTAAQIGFVLHNGAEFGGALAAADFNGDGVADLAIGAPQDRVGNVSMAGSVYVMYGSRQSGLANSGAEIWHQDVAGIAGGAEVGDRFGAALTVGDFDGDNRADLAIGVPFESIGQIPNAGGVHVIDSADTGLISTGNQFWTQDSLSESGGVKIGNRFGNSFA